MDGVYAGLQIVNKWSLDWIDDTVFVTIEKK